MQNIAEQMLLRVKDVSLVKGNGRPKDLLEYQREIISQLSSFCETLDLCSPKWKEERRRMVEEYNKMVEKKI